MVRAILQEKPTANCFIEDSVLSCIVRIRACKNKKSMSNIFFRMLYTALENSN
jgi:hypothetical protein